MTCPECGADFLPHSCSHTSLGDRVRKGMWELAQIDFDDVDPSVKVPDGYEALAEIENLLAAAEEATSILNDAGSSGDLLTALRAYIGAYAADAERLAIADCDNEVLREQRGSLRGERDEYKSAVDAFRNSLAISMRERRAAERQRDEFWAARDEAVIKLRAVEGVLDLTREVVDAYTAGAEDHGDGTYAVWNDEDLVNTIVALRAYLAACPPPESSK